MSVGTKPKSAKKRRLIGQGIKTPPEVQAQIIAALLFGQFITDEQVAEATGVSTSTVVRIRKRIPSEYLMQVETLKKDRIGHLVAEYLEKALESQIRIDAITLNEEWLLQQDAASLATFYGVKADKIFRVLEAIQSANGRNEDLTVTEDHSAL